MPQQIGGIRWGGGCVCGCLKKSGDGPEPNKLSDRSRWAGYGMGIGHDPKGKGQSAALLQWEETGLFGGLFCDSLER